MRLLTQTTDTTAGQPLPDITPRLVEQGIRLRRGQVTMVAGMPGAGKTLFVLWYAATRQLGGLFFSADSDEHTVRTRVAAMATGKDTEEVEHLEDVYGNDTFVEDLGKMVSPELAFVWESAPTIEDLTQEVLAYEETWGKPPEVVVVDNLSNVVGEGESWEGLKESFQFLHHLARKSQAAVIVLHHTSEAGDSGRKPPNPAYPQPRRHIQGKVSQLPETILTVATDGHRAFRVACVKNRSGRSSPTAEDYVQLVVHFPTMSLFDTNAEFNMAMTRRSYE